MTTRAEEIAAEGPYRADWENGMSVVRDLNAPEGNKIMMMMPENMEWFADRMNEAHAKGYKQGQQDRWIPVTRILPSAADAVDRDVLTLSPTQTNILPWQRLHEPMCPVTHWAPLPPNPEQR